MRTVSEDDGIVTRLTITDSHGGTLVSRLHAHTAHGDPLIRNFMDSILSAVSKPFFTTLQRWIFSGELHDPFQEFFVQRDTDVSLREGSGGPLEAADVGFEVGFDAIGGAEEAGRIWEKKYVFVKAMVPGFISEAFARKVGSSRVGALLADRGRSSRPVAV